MKSYDKPLEAYSTHIESRSVLVSIVRKNIVSVVYRREDYCLTVVSFI